LPAQFRPPARLRGAMAVGVIGEEGRPARAAGHEAQGRKQGDEERGRNAAVWCVGNGVSRSVDLFPGRRYRCDPKNSKDRTQCNMPAQCPAEP